MNDTNTNGRHSASVFLGPRSGNGSGDMHSSGSSGEFLKWLLRRPPTETYPNAPDVHSSFRLARWALDRMPFFLFSSHFLLGSQIPATYSSCDRLSLSFPLENCSIDSIGILRFISARRAIYLHILGHLN